MLLLVYGPFSLATERSDDELQTTISDFEVCNY